MKSKNKVKVALILLCIIAIIYSLSFKTVSATGDMLDTDKYTDIYNDPGGMTKFDTITSKILGVVQAVGSVVAVIMITVVGLRYILASPEEKAVLKDEKMKLYIIGAVILFGGVNLLSFIANNFW